MDTLLKNEVGPLLDVINTHMKRQGAQMALSVRAVIDGRNPFLVFHLKDIPHTDTGQFKLRISAGRGEDYFAIDAAPEYVNVEARSPAKLLDATRKMLASPMTVKI